MLYLDYYFKMKVKNQELYEKVKKIVNKQYKKPSAYRSGAYIKLYKEMGGEFIDNGKEKPLKNWFKQEWKDVNPLKTESSYPVYRPTKKYGKTPLTIDEIDPKNLIEQSIKKQKIKGKSNLEPFLKGGKVDIKHIEKVFNKIIKHLEEHLTEVFKGKSPLDPKDLEHYTLLKKEVEKLKGGISPKIEFSEELRKYSNPEIAQKMAYKYLGKTADIYQSWKPEKKYVIYNPDKNKFIHFGQMGYEDFTQHQNLDRRKNYLNRSMNIKGNWKDDPYSPNNLSIHILW